LFTPNPQLLKGEQKAQTVLAILGIGTAFLEAMIAPGQ
jgi:hypothetical protein